MAEHREPHDRSDRPVIHMIGNAHLDPAWMWEWGEGMEAFISTCRSALDRMEEHDEVVFTCSSAAHYQWVELSEPELFEQIRRRVDEGRWEIVGGWWTQADCNLPSGEGLLRQGMLGQEYFREKFGQAATIGYSPDAFGHTVGLPEILRRSGMNSYIFCRPDPTELELPSPLFRWFSPDGSDVVAYRVPFHYNMYQTNVRKKVSDLREALAGPGPQVGEGEVLAEFGMEWGIFYGIGNHGGGPTREQIRTIDEIAAEGEVDIRFSRLDAFLDREMVERSDLPEWHDDLQLNSPGCYSVCSAIKSLNRRSEYELVRTERLQQMEARLRAETTEAQREARNDRSEAITRQQLKDQFDMRQAWENVCFNHFHDIICGVAIREALDNAVHRYGESLAIADRIARYALRQITRLNAESKGLHKNGPGESESQSARPEASQLPPEGLRFTAINPHPHDYSGPIHFELWHDIDKILWEKPVDLAVTDQDGEEIPVQLIPTSGKIGRDRIGGTFNSLVPAGGVTGWKVHYGRKSRYQETSGLINASPHLLENDEVRIEFSERTGGIVRLIDRHHTLSLIDCDPESSNHAAVPVVIEDLTDTWGHGVTRFDRVIGRFDHCTTKLVAAGPTHGTIRTSGWWGRSRIEQEFTLYAGSPLLHARLRIVQAEPRTMIKLPFRTFFVDGITEVETGLTYIRKSLDGTERPGGAWKSLLGTIDGVSSGIGIADTLTHGYSGSTGEDLRGTWSEIALSVLRSPSYATHEPHVIAAEEDVRYIDMGEIEFRYTLRPLTGYGDEARRMKLKEDALFLNSGVCTLFEL